MNVKDGRDWLKRCMTKEVYEIRQSLIDSHTVFRRQLKTHLFNQAFDYYGRTLSDASMLYFADVFIGFCFLYPP